MCRESRVRPVQEPSPLSMYSDAAGDFGAEPSVTSARIHKQGGLRLFGSWAACAPVAQHVWGFVCVEDVRTCMNEHLSIYTARPSAIGCGEYAGPLLHLLVAGTSQPQLLRVRGSDGISLL